MTSLPIDPDETRIPSTPKRDPSRRPNSQQARNGATPKVQPLAGSSSDETMADAQTRRKSSRRSTVDNRIPMVHAEASDGADHGVAGMRLFDPLLSTLATGLDDIEKVRIAQGNRYRILTSTSEDSDGESRGFGLSAGHPAVAALDTQLKTLQSLEAAMTKALEKQLKSHPLHPWIKAQAGLGDKQTARLLHAIRDPYWNDLHDRPRTVSELWAFCGLHVLSTGHSLPETHKNGASGAKPAADHKSNDTHCGTVGGSNDSDTSHGFHGTHDDFAGVAPRRKRGQKANWSTDAKTRVYLIAESCVKQRRKPCVGNEDTGLTEHIEGCVCSVYRLKYDEGRAKYADSIHLVACAPCSALPGAPLKDGHKHARAMRLVMKAVLKDLWIESKRIYELKP